MSDYFNVTTNVGDAAIATAIANNSKLNITHIAFGDGNGSVPTPTKTRTSLVREVHRQAVTKYAMHPTIANYIVIETIIPSNIGGFWIREMGIIADNVLISHGSHAPFFKVADPDGVSEYRLKFTQNVRDGNVVEISLDESLIYASQAWVNENYIPRNELVDNLTTDDAKKPVSAKQAKNLQDNKLDKTANAVSSSKLETARTVSFSGAATGSFNFDGSGNSSCVLALANSGVVASTYGAALKIPVLTVNAKGLITGVSEQNIPIVDDLTTNDSTKPISAKQAKVLNENKLNRTSSLFQEFNLARRDFDGIHTEYTWLNGPNNSIAGTLFFNYSEDWIGKIFFDITENRMFAQSFQYGVAATPWKEIAYIDDNVASSTKLKTPRNVFGQTFDGSGDVGGTITASTGLIQASAFHFIDMGRSGLDRMNFHNYGANFNFINTINGEVVARISGYGIDCNAASASKLKLPRKINNVDFDGTSDITVTDDALTYMPIPYPKSSPPSGYLAMMGQAISESTYPKLYALYGAVLPDMRAYSVRGLDYGRGIDVGRTVLSQQGDAIRNITGALSTGAYNSGASGVFVDQGAAVTRPDGESRAAISIGFDASRVVPTASENRVKNIAFLYIVKAG